MATITAARERFEELTRSLDETVDRAAVARAFLDAEKLYEGHAHRTEKPVLEHCIDLIEEMAPFGPDTDLIVAALLHHVPELQVWTFEELEKHHGHRVRAMISEIHVLRHLTTHNRKVSIERLRLNFFRVSKDVRVFLLMLCHQLMTMQHLGEHPAEERKRIASDAVHLYAPAAARLGMYSLKHALEDAGFPVLYPIDHERVTEQLKALRGKHGAFLGKTAEAVRRELEKQGLHVEVEGREKHSYSIFQKMRRKTVTHIEGIPDLFALRVVIGDNLSSCYQALGCLHRLGVPLQNRFKDYIAFPKPNGYQSLHTTLLGLPFVPPGVMVEVQIRTRSMHREASIGVAAHWSYKEAGRGYAEKSKTLVERAFMSEAGPGQPHLADHIFVLTPKGDVVELPDGATPLDFAFQVHTAIGLTFKAARVNGSIASLDHRLENGDVVDIVRGNDPKPSPRWINLLKTASARNRLKRHLALQDRSGMIEEAKTAALVSKGLPVKKEAVLRVARVDGSIPMPVKMAKCCKPSAEEHHSIVGVIGRTGDVRVHRVSCKMLRAGNPERRIGVSWGEPIKRGAKK